MTSLGITTAGDVTVPTKVDDEPEVIVVILVDDTHRELWHISHATAVTELS